MNNSRDIERKARTVLHKLSVSGAILLPVIGEAGKFGVYNTATPGSKPRTKISSEYVRAFLTRGWLEAVRTGYILSQAAEAWLKRCEAGEDAFRAQHQVIRTKTIQSDCGTSHIVKSNHMESPLEWLHRRKDRQGNPLISVIQYQAGDRLRADFTRAGLAPRVTADWSPTRGAVSKRRHGEYPHSSSDIQDNAIEAKQRLNAALDFVGPEMSGIVVDVCCHLKGLEESEKSKGWPQRSGKVVLQIALTRLARYYGLEGTSGNSSVRTQHCGAEDYRPEL